jgi:Family of unknown function (DUF5329)
MKFVPQLSAAVIVAGFAATAIAQTPRASEAQKIEYLIATIQSLRDAAFVRNGVVYDADAAAQHLRVKWRLSRRRCETAEDFIRFCAARSSISGGVYSIRFSDGRTSTAESFLREMLSKYRPSPP